jgi:hypothetical protein
MHDRAGSMIPFLRKISGKIGNPWDKGTRTKKYDDIKSFLEVKITRDDLSKQERKSHRSLLPTLQLLRKERHHEEMGTYISQVSIHAYWSLCIAFNIVRWVFHHHLLDSAFSNPTSFRVCLCALTSQVVCFLTLPPFECAFMPSLPFEGACEPSLLR